MPKTHEKRLTLVQLLAQRSGRGEIPWEATCDPHRFLAAISPDYVVQIAHLEMKHFTLSVSRDGNVLDLFTFASLGAHELGQQIFQSAATWADNLERQSALDAVIALLAEAPSGK